MKSLMLAFFGITVMSHGAMTVELNNREAQMPIYVDNYGNPPPEGMTVYAMVYASARENPVCKVGTTGTHLSDYVFPVDQNGYFDGGVGVVQGWEAGAAVEFCVVAWTDSNLGTGTIPGYNRGYSEVWSQKVGTWDPESGTVATGTALKIPNSVVIGVPEAPSLVLATLGGGFLLAINKKTQRSKRLKMDHLN
jgi:hypothetical protein